MKQHLEACALELSRLPWRSIHEPTSASTTRTLLKDMVAMRPVVDPLPPTFHLRVLMPKLPASATLAPLLGTYGVGFVVGVALRAVGNVRHSRRRTSTTEDVDLLSYKFKVGRTDTVANSTEMIGDQLWVSITRQNIAMSDDPLTVKVEAPVSIARNLVSPQPAVAKVRRVLRYRASLVDLRPEPNIGVGTGILTGHGNQPSCVMGRTRAMRCGLFYRRGVLPRVATPSAQPASILPEGVR